jgi:thioredoxin reductase (NADPH)
MRNEVIIIGSGPAAAARGGLDPLVISGNEPGGQLIFTTEVENFTGFPEAIQGQDLMENMRKRAKKFGTRSDDSAVSSVDFSTKRRFCWG